MGREIKASSQLKKKENVNMFLTTCLLLTGCILHEGCVLLCMAPVQFQFILKISLEGQPPGTHILQLMLSFGNLVLTTR